MANPEVCEWCDGRGYRDVQYGEYNHDAEVGCSECCEHKHLELLPGPGVGCRSCGSWFADREAAEREVSSR